MASLVNWAWDRYRDHFKNEWQDQTKCKRSCKQNVAYFHQRTHAFIYLIQYPRGARIKNNCVFWRRPPKNISNARNDQTIKRIAFVYNSKRALLAYSVNKKKKKKNQIFNHVNACESMCLLVKIYNNRIRVGREKKLQREREGEREIVCEKLSVW